MRLLKNIIILLLFIISTHQTTAQIIGNNQTELLKPFRAKLAKSKKFETSPHLPKLDTSLNKELNFTIPTHLLSLLYPAPVIRPLAMPRSKEKEKYTFFAKAGIGYPPHLI